MVFSASSVGSLILVSVAPSAAFETQGVRNWMVDVCKTSTIEEDPFEGTKVVKASGAGYQLSMNEGSTLLGIDVGRSGLIDEVLPVGLPMAWVLEDGSMVTFYTDRPSKPTGGAFATESSAGVYTRWRLTFQVSLEAAQAVANSPPELMRYTIRDSQETVELKKSKARMYARDFACIANEMASFSASAADGELESDHGSGSDDGAVPSGSTEDE